MFRLFIILFILSPFGWVSPLFAGVQVQDQVATTGKGIMLSARTGSTFFAKGGEIVEFFLDGRSLGKRLSGGDGYAYMEYKPDRKGLFTIKVEHGNEKAEGLLLVVGKAEEVLLVGIEGGVLESIFPERLRDGVDNALKKLADRYRIIYITGMPLGPLVRERIREWGLPESVVLRWDRSVYEGLSDLGVKIKAVVGSPGLIAEVDDDSVKRYTFEESEEGKVVDSWHDLLSDPVVAAKHN
ncbi:MAG: hypothetical protein D6726_11470 [Nitrospirae bacterium]|nr:MAG: hypothetical protein D6726_11470 [Nitrospirota bacterium]